MDARSAFELSTHDDNDKEDDDWWKHTPRKESLKRRVASAQPEMLKGGMMKLRLEPATNDGIPVRMGDESQWLKQIGSEMGLDLPENHQEKSLLSDGDSSLEGITVPQLKVDGSASKKQWSNKFLSYISTNLLQKSPRASRPTSNAAAPAAVKESSDGGGMVCVAPPALNFTASGRLTPISIGDRSRCGSVEFSLKEDSKSENLSVCGSTKGKEDQIVNESTSTLVEGSTSSLATVTSAVNTISLSPPAHLSFLPPAYGCQVFIRQNDATRRLGYRHSHPLPYDKWLQTVVWVDHTSWELVVVTKPTSNTAKHMVETKRCFPSIWAESTLGMTAPSLFKKGPVEPKVKKTLECLQSQAGRRFCLRSADVKTRGVNAGGRQHIVQLIPASGETVIISLNAACEVQSLENGLRGGLERFA
ncbi:hypothetical protein HDU97_007073 [Phlyctochytrium planicorne]|nr:hypothetical protein HDU97_007073 [Phlyctochytrium planicorne]